MDNYYVTLIMLFLIYFIEGLHDNRLEKLYNSKHELKYVKEWHKYDLVFHILVGVLISYLLFGVSFKSLLTLINIGFIRQLTLNSVLNIKRKRKIYHLGSTSKIDVLIKKIEKSYFIFLIIINVIIAILINKL